MLISISPEEATYCCQLLSDLDERPPDDLDIVSYQQTKRNFEVQQERISNSFEMHFSKTQAEELYKILEYIQDLEPWTALPIADAVAKRLKAGIDTYIPQEKLQ